jgi:hypothetical protein
MNGLHALLTIERKRRRRGRYDPAPVAGGAMTVSIQPITGGLLALLGACVAEPSEAPGCPSSGKHGG